MARGLTPRAHIFSNTSFAIGPVMVPDSMSRIKPASAAGDTGTSSISAPVSFTWRKTSPMIQLLAAFGLPAAAAVASK